MSYTIVIVVRLLMCYTVVVVRQLMRSTVVYTAVVVWLLMRYTVVVVVRLLMHYTVVVVVRLLVSYTIVVVRVAVHALYRRTSGYLCAIYTVIVVVRMAINEVAFLTRCSSDRFCTASMQAWMEWSNEWLQVKLSELVSEWAVWVRKIEWINERVSVS